MTEFKSGVDLSLMEGVLRQYQDDSTSLITILQQAQAIYGYLPQDVIYHVAAAHGQQPGQGDGCGDLLQLFPPAAHGEISDHAVRGHGLPCQRIRAHPDGHLPRSWASTTARRRRTECLP